MHPEPQALRHLISAFPGDDDLELGFEVERLEARRALLEMQLDLVAALVGELPVEEVVEGLDRFLALGPAPIVGVPRPTPVLMIFANQFEP
jgi:hypothetical protein